MKGRAKQHWVNTAACLLLSLSAALAQVQDPTMPAATQGAAPGEHRRKMDEQRKKGTVNAPVDPRFKLSKDTKIESHIGRPRLAHFMMVGGGLGLPGGDLNTRFGTAGCLTAGYTMLLKNHMTLGVEGSYGFGGTLKQDPLSTLRDSNGDIPAADGAQGVDQEDERLWVFPAVKIGYMFVLRERKKARQWEQALLLQAGYAWMEYKYYIQDVGRDIAPLFGDRIKGYDRLTAGPGGLLEATYLLENPTGRYALFGRAQYMGCAVQSKRTYDYNYHRVDVGTKYASNLSLQIGIALTFFALDEKDYFYY